MFNSVHDLIISKNFGVQRNPARAPRIIEVQW